MAWDSGAALGAGVVQVDERLGGAVLPHLADTGVLTTTELRGGYTVDESSPLTALFRELHELSGPFFTMGWPI
jgi:hypothetical protein